MCPATLTNNMSPASTDEQKQQQQQPPARVQNMTYRPSEPVHLLCPRCKSFNTKFCYYNNYNLSQPRHFCKSCRRYWTRGGTLRNIPVGGGSRKSNKRSCTTSPAPPSTITATGPSTSLFSSTVTTSVPAKQVTQANGSPFCFAVNLNVTAAEDSGSVFKGQHEAVGPFMPLGYFGFGSGFGTWEQVAESGNNGGDGGGNVNGTSGAASGHVAIRLW